MSCSEVLSMMGFHCRERSAGVHRVFTPLSFADGEPIGLYFIEEGGLVRVSDNANTLMHLRSIGMDVSDRKKWKGLSHICGTFGINLERSGEVTGLAASSAASGLVSRYLGAMLAVADMAREAMGTPPEVSDYIDEVEEYLRLWKPEFELMKRPMLTGHSGRPHSFHFKLGEEYVDAARPHSGTTGSILRKIADIHNTPVTTSILIVMDDRDEPGRARVESDILSTLVKVLPFSRLANNLSGAPETRH